MTDYLLQFQEAGRAPAPQQVLQRSASALESFNERVGAALRGLFGRKGAVDEMVDEERDAVVQRLVQWVRVSRGRVGRGSETGRPFDMEKKRVRTPEAIWEPAVARRHSDSP